MPHLFGVFPDFFSSHNDMIEYKGGPTVYVGIVKGKKINFVLNTPYVCIQTGVCMQGAFTAEAAVPNILFEGHQYPTLEFESCALKGSFELSEVVIGIDYHWERVEPQQFNGGLLLSMEGDEVRAVNHIDVERYLACVISSEMSDTASLPFLKAHAVISRSWLIAQIEQKNKVLPTTERGMDTPEERICWYDRAEHTGFDVCADDHCQRYQGFGRLDNEKVMKAVDETRGEVLMYESEICDARFSKCCGGMSEKYESCWDNTPHPYLTPVKCNPNPYGMPLCDTTDAEILEQVLNDYDQETHGFFKWEVRYGQQELSELVCRRTGVDFGTIIDLVPLEKGVSGRIIRLRIVGTLRTMIIGKELEIRHALSESHLYSSAFTVVKEVVDGETSFLLKGRGWGHGVGLCQIGAAVMGEKGYSYQEILKHYYTGVEIVKRY
jgi:SpoIID/LytB domain protein